jgi:TPR repeat protein
MGKGLDDIYNLSKKYLYGDEDVAQDIERSQQLCKMAADGGHQEAQVELATSLIWGTFGEKDLERGFQELRKLVSDHPENKMAFEALAFVTDNSNEDLDEILSN